jgi:hypothetical protein
MCVQGWLNGTLVSRMDAQRLALPVGPCSRRQIEPGAQWEVSEQESPEQPPQIPPHEEQ